MAEVAGPQRPDRTNTVAVIAPAPGFLYPRGGHRDEHGRWVEAPDDTWEKFQPFLQELTEAVAELAPPDLEESASPQVEPYHIGPPGRAGMYGAVDYIITIAPAVATGVSLLAGGLALGEYALRLKRWWNNRLHETGELVEEHYQLGFTPPFIFSACIEDIRKRHHSSGRYTLGAHVRSVGLGTPTVPSGAELYTVRVAIARRTYFYIVNGRLTPYEHFAVRRRIPVPVGDTKVIPLDLPDFARLFPDTDARLARTQVFPLMRGALGGNRGR